MLRGHDDLIKTFKRLVKENLLSHGYIFFGEPQVGKHSFAMSLATFLENGTFGNGILLSETLVLGPDEKGSIGIDAVRDLKHFFSQKPVGADYRIAIIDDANMLTTQAENAILKISEEPPPHSLIILVLPSPEALMPTLRSRFQKIYFPRLNETEITKLLVDEHNLSKKDAESIAEISFGRPGRAVDLVKNENVKKIRDDVLLLLKHKKNKKDTIDNLVENNNELPYFFTNLIAELSKDVKKNYETLRSITNHMTLMNQFNTNKRIQLESALWNI